MNDSAARRRSAARAAAAVVAVASAVVATVAGVAVLAAAWLLATPAGAHWALRAADRLTPGALAVRAVHGSVLRGVRLEGLRFARPGLAVDLERLEIDPLWSALGEGRFALARVAARGGRVVVTATADSAPAREGPPALPAVPEWLEVRSLSLAAVDVDALGTRVAVDRADAAVAYGRVALESVALRSGPVSLALAASIDMGRGAARGVEGVLVWQDAEAQGGASPQQATFAGRVTLVTSPAPWRIEASWSRLTWQGSPAGEWASPGGRVVVMPGATPLRIEAEATVEGEPLPDAVAVDAAVDIDAAAVEVRELRAAGGGTTLAARGALDLDARSGFLTAELDGLDPSRFDPRLHGRLGGRAYVAVAQDGGRPILGATGLLTGELGGHALEGRLAARYAERTLDIREAVITLDEGRLAAQGRVSPESSDLRLAAELPRLGDWHPAATGALTATASVTGATHDPTVAAEVEGRELGWAGVPLPPLELTSSVSGTLARHTVRLFASAGASGSARVVVRQGVRDGVLSGTLLESRLVTATAGAWTLAAPADFALGPAVLEAGPACHREPGGGELCVTVRDRRLEATAHALPASLAAPWLPPGVAVAGRAAGRATLDWRDALTGSLELSQPSLTVRAGEEPHDFAEIQDLELRGTLGPDALDATVAARFAPGNGVVDGRVHVAPPSADGELTGELVARADDLQVIGALVPGVEGVTGQAEARLDVSGSAAAPSIDGRLAARALGAALPRYGIELHDGRATLSASGLDGAAFDGALCSDGCLALDGRLALPTKAPWRLDGRIEGRDFRLIDTDDYRATIAPDLQVTAGPDEIRVTGRFTVDDGLFVVEDLPRTAIRPVEQTVVHGRAEPERAGTAVPITLDVDAVLGDVRFVGMGIEAQLAGALDVETSPQRNLLVRGTATVEEGRFRAYGQELAIERGLLIFVGPPEDPALDIVATRQVDDARVGLRIRGTARSPQSEIFSDPAMTESEALARLLTGRSLASAGAADQQALERAAIGLGLRRALPALGRLGSTLGLDELVVDSSARSNGGALVAGKRLGEDFYLRYRHGLFEDFAGLELIYRISERFRLRTETGTAQSIDLIYQVNRGEAVAPGEEPAGLGIDAPSPADVGAPPGR
ncbi:MAG TPA: translocation/assembly module TamB domain-containing protein [Gammaproteobacteria bacterium]